MKLPLKITGVFLIFALLASCVAATENKDLPTKGEITDFIAGIPVSNNYINTVYDTVIDKHPAWNCDIWKDKNGNQLLSLYYVDSDSAKGHGSIYFNELGKEISMRGVDVQLVESYVGKVVPEDITPASIQKQSAEEVQSIGDEQLAEYEERLDEYEGRLDEYEGDQSVKYENQPVKYDPTSVEDVAKTVDDAAHTVENAAKTVEDVAQKVDNEEEAKWYKKISTDIFAGIVVAFIVCILRLNH